jgi:RNase P/RNase MRP subunit p30
MFIDENTDRATLDTLAVEECGFDAGTIKYASDEALLDMIREWVLEGDECAAA